MYLKYLVETKAITHLEPTEGKYPVVPDIVLRRNFIPFWKEFVERFGLTLDEVSIPEWAIQE